MESRELTPILVNVHEDMYSILVVYRDVIKPPPVIINNVVYTPLPLTNFFYQIIKLKELLGLPSNPIYPLHTTVNYPSPPSSHTSHQPVYAASPPSSQWWSNTQHPQNDQQWADNERPCSCMRDADVKKEDEHLITFIDNHK